MVKFVLIVNVTLHNSFNSVVNYELYMAKAILFYTIQTTIVKIRLKQGLVLKPVALNKSIGVF